jgi:SAM-dependent methyltransferase
VDEKWETASLYEPFIGRWSRLVADRFLDWLTPAPKVRWLDVGCGTGALTEAILRSAMPALVCGVDPSNDYVQFAIRRIVDVRARFLVANAEDLSDAAGAYDYVVSGLSLNFLPDPNGALEEMKRVSDSGGCIAAYVWDYSAGMEMLRYFWDAARELDPNAASADEAVRFPMCNPESLVSLWGAVGLGEVAVIPIDVDTKFHDFDDFWSPFLGAQGPAPGYTMSLPESAREDLKALIRRRLPVGADDSIPLRARAWAVRCRT